MDSSVPGAAPGKVAAAEADTADFEAVQEAVHEKCFSMVFARGSIGQRGAD